MKYRMRLYTSWLAALLAVSAHAQESTKTPSGAGGEKSVVFVCEHGAAQSVVAAAYFNKLATERKLPYRAIARGTSPQEDISVSAAKGLRLDGLAPTEQKPTKLSSDEAARASRVVAFLELPSEFNGTNVEEWKDVPQVGAGYEKARDMILEHIGHLLDELQPRK